MTDGPDSGPDVPEFGAERVRLRRLNLADAPGLHETYGDADSMRFWDAPPSRDIGETEARIRQSTAAEPTWHVAWAVLGKQDEHSSAWSTITPGSPEPQTCGRMDPEPSVSGARAT